MWKGRPATTTTASCPLWPVLEAMRLATPPGASLWSFSLDELTLQFNLACQALKLSSLKPHLYNLRHGGASDDLLTGRRGRKRPAARR